jgi:hypothetical protein
MSYGLIDEADLKQMAPLIPSRDRAAHGPRPVALHLSVPSHVHPRAIVSEASRAAVVRGWRS